MFCLVDRKFRKPRIWSNRELEKFSYLFVGSAINVSGWQDKDKGGNTYKSYFSNVSEYYISNYKSEARGYQGNIENEIFLDLSVPINQNLFNRFDVVFNHTVLEHVFEVDTAFNNLCKLSNDIVILVVPFLQEQHADYGDFWRFTPQAIDQLFKKSGLNTVYINYNDERNASIYLFAIGSKHPNRWDEIRQHPENKLDSIYTPNLYIGKGIIKNTLLFKIINKFRNNIT